MTKCTGGISEKYWCKEGFVRHGYPGGITGRGSDLYFFQWRDVWLNRHFLHISDSLARKRTENTKTYFSSYGRH